MITFFLSWMGLAVGLVLSVGSIALLIIKWRLDREGIFKLIRFSTIRIIIIVILYWMFAILQLKLFQLLLVLIFYCFPLFVLAGPMFNLAIKISERLYLFISGVKSFFYLHTTLGRSIDAKRRHRDETARHALEVARHALEVEEKRKYDQKKLEIKKLQETCTHEPGSWEMGYKYCIKCRIVLEACNHPDWIFVTGYKDESQYRCSRCGMGSF